MSHDSRPETEKHAQRVAALLEEARGALWYRGQHHDDSKMEAPELEVFDEYTPKLKDSTYGTDEYYEFLAEMRPALDHHYAENRHHPEHYTDGINGMNLIDLMEMLADWKAASERHDDGSIIRSMALNTVRFTIDSQLERILMNTLVYLKWAGRDSQS